MFSLPAFNRKSHQDFSPLPCISGELVFDCDTLHLGEEVVGILPSLPSHPRVLHPSKGQVQIPHQPAVGPHQTCLYFLGHPVNPPHVPGPHSGTQAITDTVALGNSLILRVEWADTGDRAEDLLLHDTGTVGYA